MEINTTLKRTLGLWLILMLCLISGFAEAHDPWRELQLSVDGKPAMQALRGLERSDDPWETLRATYLPFSEAEETAAFTHPDARRRFSGYMHKVLQPYRAHINKASAQFDIPREVIGAVIMVESAGNERARAKTSSARGLMQTISGTFREARRNLKAQGIVISDTPYEPLASIMAGSWYLDRMYQKARIDRKKGVYNRKHINSWRYPVEYYYAGPRHGRKETNIAIIYAGGRRVVIDKRAYSRKVIRWARIMNGQG